MRWILFVVTLPWLLTVGWLLPCIALLVGLAEKPKWEGTVLTVKTRGWLADVWRFSTSIGGGIFYHPRVGRFDADQRWSRLQEHEHVHYRQSEDYLLTSFLTGLAVWAWTGDQVAAVALWWSGGLWPLVSYVASWLRGNDIYRDAEIERSARAQTDESPEGVRWLDAHKRT